MNTLIDKVLTGNRRALGKMLTIVENQYEGMDEALRALFPHTGKAWIVGITGSPGAGKSSLVSCLASAFRQQDKTVGIIAVDPTSPFTGGAILGDRIRMSNHVGDKGVFIRSMATRGSLGGISATTQDAVRVMDAAGYDVVLVETVGAGQSEVEIVRTAHTTIVVEAPGLGDDIQAIKAGILEIADILVVNKADRPGANRTTNALRMMLELGHPSAKSDLISHHGQLIQIDQSTHNTSHENHLWIPPVLSAVATENQGIDEIIQKIDAHRDYLVQTNEYTKLQALTIEDELIKRLQNTLLNNILQSIPTETFQKLLTQIQARELDPQSAAQYLLEHFGEQKIKTVHAKDGTM